MEKKGFNLQEAGLNQGTLGWLQRRAHLGNHKAFLVLGTGREKRLLSKSLIRALWFVCMGNKGHNKDLGRFMVRLMSQ